MSKQFNLDRIFTHHPPFGTQLGRYEMIRAAAREFATLLEQFCPPSRELSSALTSLQQSAMWANAAIAINEVQKEVPVVEEAQVAGTEAGVAA